MDVSGISCAPVAQNSGGMPALERKFMQLDEVAKVEGGVEIKGYASFFDAVDQGNDVVQRGAYGASLMALVQRFETGGFSTRDVLALLCAGLRGGGVVMDPDVLASAEIEGGPMRAAQAAAELLARAFVVEP